MKNNIVSDILKYLERFNEKPINLEQMGFVSSKLYIEKLVFNINYDILDLKDEISNMYLAINLNQIYEIENLDNGMCLYLDNDIKIKLY